MIFVFLYLTYFTYYDNVSVHLCCIRHYFTLFMVEECSIVCVYPSSIPIPLLVDI